MNNWKFYLNKFCLFINKKTHKKNSKLLQQKIHHGLPIGFLFVIFFGFHNNSFHASTAQSHKVIIHYKLLRLSKTKTTKAVNIFFPLSLWNIYTWWRGRKKLAMISWQKIVKSHVMTLIERAHFTVAVHCHSWRENSPSGET